MKKKPAHAHVTGHNGNEIFCLDKIGMRPGQLCVGNSVIAMGVGKSFGAGLKSLAGGEVASVSNLVNQSRKQALERLLREASLVGSDGVTGVTFELINHGGNFEFLALGSGVHDRGTRKHNACFSSAGDAQQLFCLVDSGFVPKHLVFGNVAYSIGVGGNILGGLQGLRRGEVPQFSQAFDTTRHLALKRIKEDAQRHTSNCVVGIETTISSLFGAQEMVLVGTGSHHPLLPETKDPATSDMTPEETWNMAHLGYLPLQLVMGVSVYSLGLTRKISSAFDSLAGGEMSSMAEMLYDARDQALVRIEQQAQACGADEVVGIKLKVYELGFGLFEVLALGTAVKKVSGASTRTDVLPAQAIIRDRETLITSDGAMGLSDTERMGSATRVQGAPLRLALVGLGTATYLFLKNVVFAH